MKKIVVIMGSASDRPHADKIINGLQNVDGYDLSNYSIDVYTASAHKEPLKVLGVLDSHKGEKALVYITIAGRSNALSGFCAANCSAPVIACPPFADKTDMMVNIHSTLQMPSRTPVLTVLDPGNTAIAAMRILALADCGKTAAEQQGSN